MVLSLISGHINHIDLFKALCAFNELHETFNQSIQITKHLKMTQLSRDYFSKGL
jgi:hypothetical protein